jgi:hypothetical protein
MVRSCGYRSLYALHLPWYPSNHQENGTEMTKTHGEQCDLIRLIIQIGDKHTHTHTHTQKNDLISLLTKIRGIHRETDGQRDGYTHADSKVFS